MTNRLPAAALPDAEDLPPWLRPSTGPFGFLEILERLPSFGDEHGPLRLAILFLGADGVATYDALFCQEQSAPYAVVVEDSGFGGGWTPLGHGGMLEKLAFRCSVFPEWQWVAENTGPWDTYFRVPDAPGVAGGMWNRMRYLYKRESTPARSCA